MTNIEKNKIEREKYTERYFKKEGVAVIEKFLENLVLFYHKKKEFDYPFNIGIILGVPLYKGANYVKNKDELMGRIKALAQIIGKKRIKVNLGANSKMEMEI